MVTPTASPHTAREAAALLAEAFAAGRPVAIVGSGSRFHWQPAAVFSNGIERSEALVVSTMSIESPFDIRAGNLTATFPAGAPLQDVHERLATENLWLPLMHLDAAESTLGGCVAAGFVNPLRLAFGLPRDWVLGLEVVSPQGDVLTLGGELVKNVAGYDLVRPHVGAWGRLGLLTRVTVRLLPAPEARVTAVLEWDAGTDSVAELEELLRRVLMGRACPSALEVSLNPAGMTRVRADFVGSQASVAARVARLGWSRLCEGPARQAEWDAYVGERDVAAASLPWQARLSVPAPGLQRVVESVARVAGDRAWYVSGHAGSGVFRLNWRDEAGPATVLEGLRRELAGDDHEGRAFLVAEGAAAASMCGANGWAGFPPRPPRGQDAVESAFVRALTGGRPLNPHLALPTLSTANRDSSRF